MVILTLNCGSSSAKYQAYDWDKQEVLAVGVVERIGLEYSTIEHKVPNKEDFSDKFSCPTHKEAIELIIKLLLDKERGVIKNIKDIGAVGHRVVHGGETFKQSTLVTDEVIEKIRKLIPVAPLHNPANLLGIEAARKVVKDCPHAIIMDTAWHQSIEKPAFLYALPYQWYKDYNVRRYGFHGTSYVYVAKRAAVLLNKDPLDCNLIICHIGNGASMSAVKNGVCIDTTMGFTPLEGLVMGSRSGDIDPAIIPYMMERLNVSAKEIDTILNKKSGLVGICGLSDRRDVQEESDKGNERAILAHKMESRRIKKYIGSFYALLGHVDAIVFTAGVGEMSPWVRWDAINNLENLGIKVDKDKNNKAQCRNAELEISSKDSKTKVFIIPTDEELVMTEDAYALVKGTYDIHTKFQYSFAKKGYVNKARAAALKKDLEKKPYLKELIVG